MAGLTPVTPTRDLCLFTRPWLPVMATALNYFFELRAAGYNGSTYTLSYDAANDRLTGVYDQVVVKQKFDVIFVRDKS
jgi:hypothetical protein